MLQRVISLFREADDGYPEADFEPPLGVGEQHQPIYFVQLLNYLREQKDEADADKSRAGAD